MDEWQALLSFIIWTINIFIFKLLETTHRRLRLSETRQQTEMKEITERLTQEEEAVGVLRQEVLDKEQQVEKMKHLVKEVSFFPIFFLYIYYL